MLEAFKEASHSIHAEFYIVRDDCTGCAFADALVQAAGRGIEVRLIYDYIGCFDTPASFFRKLEQGGVHCLPFNPPSIRRGVSWFDKRDHRKVALIDGVTAFAGGINIADEYSGYGESPKHWRDLGVRIDGPAVRELESLFRSSWEDEGGDLAGWTADETPLPPWSGDAEVMIVSGGPHHNRSFIRSAFRMAIAGASESIRIANPYFVPGPRIVRSLLRAASRGVKVQLMLPAVSDVPLVRLVSRSYYAQLLKAGIEIYEREGTVLHAKLMLIDGCWGVIGSANLDQRSFHRNFEINLIVDNARFGGQVEELFNADLARSRRVVLEEHERRGWYLRFLERCCEPISWFL
jgi:cardiolipin synthase